MLGGEKQNDSTKNDSDQAGFSLKERLLGDGLKQLHSALLSSFGEVEMHLFIDVLPLRV